MGTEVFLLLLDGLAALCFLGGLPLGLLFAEDHEIMVISTIMIYLLLPTEV